MAIASSDDVLRITDSDEQLLSDRIALSDPPISRWAAYLLGYVERYGG